MNKIKGNAEAYQQNDFFKPKAALTTLMPIEGSAYQRTGAQMPGPVKKAGKMMHTLADGEKALSEKDGERIYAPAGLDIGADEPEVIALSILAEIQGHFKKKQGHPLRMKSGTIHEP